MPAACLAVAALAQSKAFLQVTCASLPTLGDALSPQHHLRCMTLDMLVYSLVPWFLSRRRLTRTALTHSTLVLLGSPPPLIMCSM
jgi:hypothetical protein